jgi:hypothetical protein
MAERISHEGIEAQTETWNHNHTPVMTYEEIALFWEQFLKLNDIPKREFLKELTYDNNHVNALERLFAKMNASATKRKKKSASGKRGGTH